MFARRRGRLARPHSIKLSNRQWHRPTISRSNFRSFLFYNFSAIFELFRFCNYSTISEVKRPDCGKSSPTRVVTAVNVWVCSPTRLVTVVNVYPDRQWSWSSFWTSNFWNCTVFVNFKTVELWIVQFDVRVDVDKRTHTQSNSGQTFHVLRWFSSVPFRSKTFKIVVLSLSIQLGHRSAVSTNI